MGTIVWPRNVLPLIRRISTALDVLFTLPSSTMARGEEPLLHRSDSPDESLRAEEEDALLTGERAERAPASRWQRWREIGLFTWALLATAALIIVAVILQKQRTVKESGPNPSGKRNLIFMVSDGMGPTSLSLTRSFRQLRDGLPIDDTLVLDQHLIGSSRTRSTSSLVTDSAAGA